MIIQAASASASPWPEDTFSNNGLLRICSCGFFCVSETSATFLHIPQYAHCPPWLWKPGREGFLSVYIIGGSSKCFLSSSLHVNKFLNSHICVKKAEEVESEIDIIQAFKNTQNTLLFFFFLLLISKQEKENSSAFTRCLN